jgi:phosphoserine aminotransferase
MGPAGVTVVIMHPSVLKQHQLKAHKHHIPAMMDYSVALKAGSLYNTPPTYAIYMTGLVMRHSIKYYDGVQGIERYAGKKCHLVNYCITKSDGFYVPCVKNEEMRSRINITVRIHKNAQPDDVS